MSASQVHRLVTGTRERLSLPVLAALCDIFEATPADLIVTAADNVGVRKTATGDMPATPAEQRSCGRPGPASDPKDEPPPMWERPGCCSLPGSATKKMMTRLAWQ